MVHLLLRRRRGRTPLQNAIAAWEMDAVMATVFLEGENHNHRPSGRWSEVQKKINSPGAAFMVPTICENSSDPATVVWWARQHLDPFILGSGNPLFNPHPFDDPLLLCPNAPLDHVDHYLKKKGADYTENFFLEMVLKYDDGVRTALGRRLPTGSSGVSRPDYFELRQVTYSLDWARSSWGAIDKFCFEVDFDAETLHVWFKDRYEWHPCYPGLYDVQEGDFARETNCVHAAFVEMKLHGAEDFWMVGEATVPLKGFPGYKGKAKSQE
jgi:hypothetical protein